MENIGKTIKEKRKERKLTQSQLGEKVNACYVSIGNLEKGKNVNTNLLRDVCNELNLELQVVEKITL
jgi:transcriptional regulator with XRE-family HTH domain